MKTRNLRKSYCLIALAALLCLAPAAAAQRMMALAADPNPAPQDGLLPKSAANPSETILIVPSELPRMAPELALARYEYRVSQTGGAFSYSAVTVIAADLPDSQQHGEFELEKSFTAPGTLKFKAVRYTGDSFVKSNVITRLLQAEVDHVAKERQANTQVSSANYKFSYKDDDMVDGRPVHVYQVKPRKDLPGLFKGRIYIDAYTGSLLRAEGTMVKSPSFWVKKIDFVQDFTEVDGHLLPVHTHSVAKARIIGRAIVDIVVRDYNTSVATVAESTSAGGSGEQH